jgi:hypothetical protein
MGPGCPSSEVARPRTACTRCPRSPSARDVSRDASRGPRYASTRARRPRLVRPSPQRPPRARRVAERPRPGAVREQPLDAHLQPAVAEDRLRDLALAASLVGQAEERSPAPLRRSVTLEDLRFYEAAAQVLPVLGLVAIVEGSSTGRAAWRIPTGSLRPPSHGSRRVAGSSYAPSRSRILD